LNTIVIGAGVDALVAAHVLARAGHRVTLLHERSLPIAASGWVPAALTRALSIKLEQQRPDPWAAALLPDGGTLELWHDMARSVEAIRRLSPRDAARWPEFCDRMAALAWLLGRLYAEPPAAPLDLRFAWRVRRLGRRGMVDLMRLLPMSAAELLDDWFEGDALKGLLGATGILHLQQGPRSGGTAFRLLHHHVGCPRGVFRQARSDLGPALQIRSGISARAQPVERILVKAGRATGVVLPGGEEIPADLVLSGVGACRTLLELADPGWLDPELVQALTHVRSRGVAARIRGDTSEYSARTVVVAPSLDYLERAYDAAKYGRVSTEPYLEAHYGRSRVEVHLQFAPHRLSDGVWDAERRAGLARLAAERLPGLSAGTLSVEVPPDLEASEGWPQGQPLHAELALDQALWSRPLPGLAQYRSPIDGLWLCGVDQHPGVAGIAGYHCARAVQRLRA
jgi:phytoene dehydrogenase-like protein